MMTCPECEYPLSFKRWYMGRKDCYFCVFCYVIWG